MTYNLKTETFNKQKEWIKKILNKHKNEKGIIHTSNYEIANWIQEQMLEERFIFHETNNRLQALNQHLNNDDNSVIVSPSLDTGIDLKDENGRFQIILKIPFPNISSNKVKQRQRTNKDWYNWSTCCTLMQSYGRSIRSIDDYAKTYILDESFSSILTQSGTMLPRWFTNAIKIIKF
jgi:Rad3-related DNA helicase